MKYGEPPRATRDDLAAALDREDPATVIHSLLGLVQHDGDWRWLQETCLRLLDHGHPEVRANAITALGHIARIHGWLDRERVVGTLDDLGRIHPELSGRIGDALDDIERFTPADRPE